MKKTYEKLVNIILNPVKMTALYDKSCRLCKQTRKTLEKLDWLNKVEWISLQEYEQLNEGIKIEAVELRREIHIIDKRGNIQKGYYAIRRMFLLFPVTLLLGLIMYIPFSSLIGNPIYKWIANNRHRFFRKKCDDGSCSL
ncbi:MAG TPA: DUF393 domain-containing protein [Bacillus bacterium]|nr:DUF393 domain-containing protein [Bacillus sp. (in: firmicutes)]